MQAYMIYICVSVRTCKFTRFVSIGWLLFVLVRLFLLMRGGPGKLLL